MGAIHSTKISENFGPKLNGSARSNRKSFEKTGPPFEVDHFSRSDQLEFWLNGSRPIAILISWSYDITVFVALLCTLSSFSFFYKLMCILWSQIWSCQSSLQSGRILQGERFGRRTDGELGRVKKWFQERGWWVKIGEGEGRKNMPAHSHCSLANAIHRIDRGSDWWGVGCQHFDELNKME